MKSRLEKNHGQKGIDVRANQVDASSDVSATQGVYEQQHLDNPVKKKWSLDDMNRFLNYGIVILSILLAIILVVAFSK